MHIYETWSAFSSDHTGACFYLYMYTHGSRGGHKTIPFQVGKIKKIFKKNGTLNCNELSGNWQLRFCLFLYILSNFLSFIILPYGAKVKVACRAYLRYLSVSIEIDFFQFWRTYFSFILMSATFWRMSNFPVSALASTWDELSILDQTLQLLSQEKTERNIKI